MQTHRSPLENVEGRDAPPSDLGEYTARRPRGPHDPGPLTREDAELRADSREAGVTR